MYSTALIKTLLRQPNSCTFAKNFEIVKCWFWDLSTLTQALQLFCNRSNKSVSQVDIYLRAAGFNLQTRQSECTTAWRHKLGVVLQLIIKAKLELAVKSVSVNIRTSRSVERRFQTVVPDNFLGDFIPYRGHPLLNFITLRTSLRCYIMEIIEVLTQERSLEQLLQ